MLRGHATLLGLMMSITFGIMSGGVGRYTFGVRSRSARSSSAERPEDTARQRSTGGQRKVGRAYAAG